MTLWITASIVLGAWALLSVVGNEQSRRVGELERKLKAKTDAAKAAAAAAESGESDTPAPAPSRRK